jgi:uncharacterized protein YbjQ (UPF0145 family)
MSFPSFARQGGWLLAAAIALTSATSFAAESEFFRISELLQSETAKETLAAPVVLYWGAQPTPRFAEVADEDSYVRWSTSRSPFGGSRRHCVDAFEQALRAMVGDAISRGYDAIIGITAASDARPSSDPGGFYCKPGYRSTEVRLTGSFAMTQDAVRLAAEEDAFVLEGPPRPPWDHNVYLPLEPILTSPEAKAILGTDVAAHWGLQAPAYVKRYGPDVYYDYGDIALGTEVACKQAVLKVLLAMADYARANKYDAVIRIRSYLYDLHTPVATDFECEVGKRKTTVRLKGTLAKLKS